MKKLKSRVATVLVAVMVMIFSTDNPILAAENEAEYDDIAIQCNYELEENNDSSSEYFRFSNSCQRMDSNGNFTFSFSWAMQSSSFKPASSSIKVYMTATSSTSDKTYYIELYKIGSDNPLKSVKYTADGTSQYYKFTGLDEDSSYYLYFSKPLLSNATITGSGHIDYIQ